MSTNFELRNLQITRYREMFHKCDVDKNGTISIEELKHLIEYQKQDVPSHAIEAIFHAADSNQDDRIDLTEFMAMIENPKNSYFFFTMKQWANPSYMLHEYVNLVFKPRIKEQHVKYSLWPPPIIMVIITIIEISFYFFPSISMYLIYNPARRKEVWRYVTYIFVHLGVCHIVVNSVIQLILGVPLEMINNGWRVVIVYLAGVVAGSLGTSIFDPKTSLAGASGGVYSLMTAHMAQIFMNWTETSYPIIKTSIYSIIICSDTIYSYNFRNYQHGIGYLAHFFGGLAGLLVGTFVLKNIRVVKYEIAAQWTMFAIYIALVVIAMCWHLFYPTYFPEQEI